MGLPIVPVVSILMTAFNKENFIAEAIESAINSSYVNFELIVVDDCSIDRTYQIATEFAKRDCRIRVYRNEKNIGDYPNRNKAAGYARGKYIKYLDADDYIYRNGLELIVAEMESHSDAAVGLFSLSQNQSRPYPILLTPKETYEYNFFGPGLFHKGPLSAIFRTRSFIDIGGFKTNRHTGDYEIWHRMAQVYTFLLIHDHIIWSREHDDQESKKHDINVELNYSRIEISYIFDEKSPLDLVQRKLIINRKIRKYCKQIIISLMKFNVKDAIIPYLRLLIFIGWKK